MAPWITSCSASKPKIEWQNFPGLNVTVCRPRRSFSLQRLTTSKLQNAPNITSGTGGATSAVSRNLSTPLTTPGQQIVLQWEAPGKQVGPNFNYTTTTSAGTPKASLL